MNDPQPNDKARKLKNYLAVLPVLSAISVSCTTHEQTLAPQQPASTSPVQSELRARYTELRALYSQEHDLNETQENELLYYAHLLSAYDIRLDGQDYRIAWHDDDLARAYRYLDSLNLELGGLRREVAAQQETIADLESRIETLQKQ